MKGSVPRVRFGILGSLEVDRDGVGVALVGAQQRVLLALLLVHANQPVPAERLVEMLWGDPTPPRAVKRLQVAIARLRKALEANGAAGGALLQTVTGGYRLALASGELDAEVFESRVENGLRALADGDVARAAELLREALALWRGPALTDVAYEPFAQAEIRRLEELRLTALEARIDADLQLGGHAELVGELEALIASHPTRERLFGQLMVALYRSGRQAEALDVYRRARLYLVAELGLEPGPALRQLERSILGQDAELDPPTVAVGRVLSPGSGSPLPRLLSASPAAFVGRRGQLERLQRALQRTSDGNRLLVLLEGEPGIGKTRLAGEFARLAHEGGALVLYGRCPEEPLAAYQAFIEALGPYVTSAPPQILRSELGTRGSDLTRLLPALAQRFPDLGPVAAADPGGERFRLFEAVDSFLSAASRSRPVVLIVDDLHWADRPSVLLIRHLVRAADPARLLLLAASRDTEQPREETLGAALVDLHRDERLDRWQLTGMTEPEVNALVLSRNSGDVAPAVSRAVFERSAGNPFFAGEFLRNLQESGVALGSTQTVLEDAGLPHGVKYAIGRRLERLSEPAQPVLTLAALLGPDLELELLARLSGLSHERLVDVVDEAVDAGLLVETAGTQGRYGFRHALISETLVDGLTAARRAYYHLRIAAALEAHDPEAHLAELAHHLLAAAPLAASAARARAYASRAAEQATARLAHDEAARLLRISLAAIERDSGAPEHEQCDVLLALGEAELRAGDSERARMVFADAVRSARRLNDGLRLARAALGTAGARPRLGIGTADKGAMAILEEALTALGGEDSPLRARVLSRLATELYWSQDRKRGAEVTQQALRVARRVGDPNALASSLHAAYVLDDDPDSLPRRSQLASELRALTHRTDDPGIGMWAQHFTLIEALELGDIARADAALASYVEGAARLRHPMHRWHAAMWTAMRHLLAGRFNQAERSALAAHAAGQHAQDLNVLQTVAVQLAHLRWEQGRTDEIIPALRVAVERDAAVPAWRAALAIAYAESDDHDRARHTFESLATDDFAELPRDSMWLGAIALLAETCGYVGDVGDAMTLRRLLEPYADRVVVVGNARVCMGSLRHYLGVLAAICGNSADAARHFEASMSVDHRLGAPARLARTQYAYACLLLDREQHGDAQRARKLLGGALAAAEKLGMRRLSAQICAKGHAGWSTRRRTAADA